MAASLPLSKRPLDILFFLFFLIHIPTTLLFDSQAVVPQEYFPEWATKAIQQYISISNDHLMETSPLFFKSLVLCEMFLQLPFFFVGAYAMFRGCNWFRVPGLLYGAHVATTLVPLLAEFYSTKNFLAMGIYMPYLIIPLMLIARLYSSERPFDAPAGKKQKTK